MPLPHLSMASAPYVYCSTTLPNTETCLCQKIPTTRHPAATHHKHNCLPIGPCLPRPMRFYLKVFYKTSSPVGCRSGKKPVCGLLLVRFLALPKPSLSTSWKLVPVVVATSPNPIPKPKAYCLS